MANIIRWYLCPLVSHPVDPNGYKQPHPWVNSVSNRRITTVRLPGSNYCIVRIRGEATLQDALVGAGAPNRFYRLRVSQTWADLTNAQRNWVLSEWPTLSVINSTPLWQVAERLAQMSSPLFTRLNVRRTDEESLTEE